MHKLGHIVSKSRHLALTLPRHEKKDFHGIRKMWSRSPLFVDIIYRRTTMTVVFGGYYLNVSGIHILKYPNDSEVLDREMPELTDWIRGQVSVL